MHIMFMPNSPSPPSGTIWSFLSVLGSKSDSSATIGQRNASEESMTETSHLLEPIQRRWSPRSFNGREVESWKLRTLFEAATWAASCNGEEPWRFLLASRSNEA